jgi:thioredoxin-like negative regulator of GroEL
MALAEGYVREAGFAGEAKFCLAEIALALRRVRSDKAAVDGLSRAAVSEALNKAIAELAERAAQIPPVPALDRYAEAAFAEAAR